MMKRLALVALAFALAALPASAQVPWSGHGVPPISVSASSGNVAAGTATATLAAGGGKRVTYICGFSATGGGATAASVVNLTVTNVVTGTMTYTFGAVAGVGVPDTPLVVQFNPCLPANASNTTIVVSMPSLGAGNTNAAVNAWGFKQN